jgi:hypothetical protein
LALLYSFSAARDAPEHSVTAIAKLLGVGAGTLCNHIPDLHELRTSRIRQLTDDRTLNVPSSPNASAWKA